MDDLDWRIIRVLQEDGGISNEALAQTVHASPATCLRRVRRLKDTGVVTRTVALLSAPAVGMGLRAVVEVSLDRQGAEQQAAFGERVKADAHVQLCFQVSSGPDFVLIVAVRDMAHYQELAASLLTADKNVRNVRTFFVVNEVKFDTSLPLPLP